MVQELALAGKSSESGRAAWVEERDEGEIEIREGEKELEREDAVSGLTPNKVYGVAVKFTETPRSAQVVMQTWAEWTAGEPGQQVELTW
jgi:hypothetical protein